MAAFGGGDGLFGSECGDDNRFVGVSVSRFISSRCDGEGRCGRRGGGDRDNLELGGGNAKLLGDDFGDGALGEAKNDSSSKEKNDQYDRKK